MLWDVLRERAGGKLSAIRIVFVLWAVVALFTWVGLSIVNGEVEPFPNSLAAIIGSLAIGKAGQRFAE
jgi:hypothetical protein